MRTIYCNQCGRELFETSKSSDGAAGAEAQRLGFVFKMPFFYTNTSGCLFFCDKKCGKKYYDKNIPKNPEIDSKLQEFRAKIPEMTEAVCKDLQKLSDQIKKKFQP